MMGNQGLNYAKQIKARVEVVRVKTNFNVKKNIVTAVSRIFGRREGGIRKELYETNQKFVCMHFYYFFYESDKPFRGGGGAQNRYSFLILP